MHWPRRLQCKLTAAREAQGEGRLQRPSAPLTPRGRSKAQCLTPPAAFALSTGHQRSPDPGQRDCRRNQVLAERLWERIVWVGQVVIVFQPLGLIPEVHRNPPHTPSPCAPWARPTSGSASSLPLLL